MARYSTPWMLGVRIIAGPPRLSRLPSCGSRSIEIVRESWPCQLDTSARRLIVGEGTTLRLEEPPPPPPPPSRAAA
eukprot:3682280-Prymnesium_polylepis.1